MIPLIICVISVIMLLLVVIAFTLETYKSDQEYKAAIKRIQRGER
jgi:hypothetical protein